VAAKADCLRQWLAVRFVLICGHGQPASTAFSICLGLDPVAGAGHAVPFACGLCADSMGARVHERSLQWRSNELALTIPSD